MQQRCHSMFVFVIHYLRKLDFTMSIKKIISRTIYLVSTQPHTYLLVHMENIGDSFGWTTYIFNHLLLFRAWSTCKRDVMYVFVIRNLKNKILPWAWRKLSPYHIVSIPHMLTNIACVCVCVWGGGGRGVEFLICHSRG